MSGLSSRIGHGYVAGCVLLSAAVVLAIGVVSLITSWSAITEVGWELFTLEWDPTRHRYGILTMLYGTCVVTLLALLIAVPIGLLTAVATAELLPRRWRFPVKSFLELLASIPSIVFGLIGIAFVSIWVQDLFDLQSGRTLLTAGCILSIMILPTIITLADDAMYQVPDQYREAASGLGLYRSEVITSTVLPIARGDLVGAVLLALGRALGETMAVMLVIGSIDRIPDPIYDWLVPGQTVTSKLGREIAESAFGSLHFSSMVFMGFILMLIVIGLTMAAQRNFRTQDRLYE